MKLQELLFKKKPLTEPLYPLGTTVYWKEKDDLPLVVTNTRDGLYTCSWYNEVDGMFAESDFITEELKLS